MKFQFGTFDSEQDIPGTDNILVDHEQLMGSPAHLLKREGDLVLIPQPSDSVNDPLNWSSFRKLWHFLLLMVVTGFTAATSNSAGAASDGMSEDLNISDGVQNTAAGVLFLGIGYSTLILSPTVYLYGRKCGYLICLLFGLIGVIWFAKIQTVQDAIWCQLFVGISEACAEAQVQLSITDIFFRHQLGSTIGLYVVATSVGTYLGPLISGFVADRLGWRWIGWMPVIMTAGLILILVFTFEETSFNRSVYQARTPKSGGPVDETGLDAEKKMDAGGGVLTTASPEVSIRDEKPTTYYTRMKLITLAPNLVGFGFRQFIRRLSLTARVFTFPAVIYAGLQWGAQDAWLSFYLTTEDDLYFDPPYNYGDVGVGLMNLPCLIGAVIGCIYGGYLSDQFVLYLARKNGGWREAENRLWLLMLTAIISPLGMFLFGIGTAHVWAWPGTYVGLGFIGFGWGCAGDLSMSYLVDCYPGMVLEGMVGVSVINNSLGSIFTFVCSFWLDGSGTQNTYIAIGVLDFFFLALTIPMIYFGKYCRHATKGSYERFLQARDGFDA